MVSDPRTRSNQAGDALVAVAEFGEEGMTVLGRGVMVAPGMLLTATHVLEEFRRDGSGCFLHVPSQRDANVAADRRRHNVRTERLLSR